jgi:hypothetical protein
MSPLVLLLAGCPIKTDNTVKIAPVDVNVNLTGTLTLNLVIADARKDMQAITGEAPARVVNLQDIGLPPAKAGSMGPRAEDIQLAAANPHASVLTLAVLGQQPMAREDDLKNNISGRNPQVRYLLDAHVAGETHTGLLGTAPGATLSVQQQAIMTAENADRKELYAIQAKAKGSSVDDIGLSYYLARLGYAKAGDWYEKSTGPDKWVWAKWGS